MACRWDLQFNMGRYTSELVFWVVRSCGHLGRHHYTIVSEEYLPGISISKCLLGIKTQKTSTNITASMKTSNFIKVYSTSPKVVFNLRQIWTLRSVTRIICTQMWQRINTSTLWKKVPRIWTSKHTETQVLGTLLLPMVKLALI